MALSQADFYAFSKATGSPYVEDPEAQAQIAPQVAEWRRNQLKSPETKQAESSSLLNALGIGAAVAGAGALLAAGLGRRGGVRMGNTQQAARQATQQVNVEDFGNVYRAAGRPAPSKPAPTPTPTPAATPRPAGSRQGGIKFADLSQIAGTEPKGLLRGRQPGADITPAAPRGALTSLEITEVPVVDITEAAEQPRLGGAKDFIAGYFQKTGTPAGYLTEGFDEIAPIADRADELLQERELNRQRDIARRIRAQEATIQGKGERLLAELQAEARSPIGRVTAVQTEKPASLVDRQNAIQSLVPDQTFNALDAAEDQMTGRVKQQLQRNEDLDMSQIDLLEEIAEYSRLQGMEQDDPLSVFAKSEYGQSALAKGYDINTVAKLKTAFDKNIIGGLGGVSPELGGEGFYIETPDFREVSLNSSLAQSLLQKAGITNEEINSFNAQRMQNLQASLQKDEPINRVASQLPDGLPSDQAEGIDLRTGERFAIKRNVLQSYPKSTLGSTGLVPGQRIQMEEEIPDYSGTSAARFLQAEREKIAQEMAADDIAAMPADVERELARRLGKEASTYGPKYTARRQALELFAKTGDPQAAETIKRFGLAPVRFETFENMPAEKRRLFESSAPMSLEGYPSEELIADIPLTGIEVDVPGAGRVDIATLRRPVVTESTALAAESYIQGRKEKALNWLAGIEQEVQPKLNEIFSERRAIIERQAAQLKPALEQAQATGKVGLVKKLESQLNALRYQFRNPESHPHRREESNLLQARLGSAQRKINADIQTYERKYPTTLSDWSGEAGRVFGELDVNTGEFIPETMELRTERPIVDLGSKGGGGRNIAEFTAGQRLDEEIRAIQGGGRIRDYDPETGAVASRWAGDETQTGRRIGIYGVQLTGEKPDNPELRPSVPQYTQQEIVNEALRMSQADPSDSAPIAPTYEAAIQSLGAQPKTAATRRSVDVSSELRRLQTSGRPGEAQAFLNKIMKQQGVSSVGEASPLPVQQSVNLGTSPSTAASIYDLPMNFAYRGQAIPDTPATTFEAIQAGLRTSTLRKPGQVPSRVQPGTRITAVGPQGQRQLLEVTGRRMVTPEMAEELSQVERWTPDFLRNYIGRVGGGKLEQITYRMI